MGGLGNIFGGDNGNDDSQSTNDSSHGSDGNILGDVSSTLGLDASSSHSSSSTDEDGNSDSSSSDQSLSIDSGTDGLLHSMGDTFGDSSSTDSTN